MPRTKLDTPAKDRTDWERLRAMPGAEVERIAAEDEDNPATDESHWANATIGVPPLKVPVNAKESMQTRGGWLPIEVGFGLTERGRAGAEAGMACEVGGGAGAWRDHGDRGRVSRA